MRLISHFWIYEKDKKIILSILTLACVSGTGAGIAYAQQSETYGMKTNHNYLVSIKAWGKNSESKRTVMSALHSCSNNAIVMPEESGKYKVTIQANNYDKMIETGWLDTANDEKCYSPDEIAVSGNDYSDNKYLTFEVDNLKDFCTRLK